MSKSRVKSTLLVFIDPVRNSHELAEVYLTHVTLSLRCNHALDCDQILIT